MPVSAFVSVSLPLDFSSFLVDPPPAIWLSDSADKLYFGRQSRDLHRYDVCLADIRTGETQVLIQEVLNTYVDVQPLRLVNGGTEMIWWSERDGWGHYYLYDGAGKLKTQITSGEFAGQRIEAAGEDSARVGVELAVDLIQNIKSWAQGVYIMPQFSRYDLVAEIIEKCKDHE